MEILLKCGIRMKRKKRLKRKFRRLLFLIIIVLILYFFYSVLNNKKYIDSVEFSNNSVVVNLIDSKKELYCMFSKNEDDDKWIKAENNKCILDYLSNSTLFIKYDDKVIYKSNKDFYYDIDPSETIYIAKNDTFNIFRRFIGNSSSVSYEYDKDIIKIENNAVNALKLGETTLNINIKDKKYTKKIIVTSYITKRPKEYDLKKSYLSCKKYTNEENELLDNILKTRIENVGYKTRAGVVEAARFLTLDFPYKINYFYENGRQTTNKVDGEGRYYHVGLYLSTSKYSTLTGSTTTNNKGPWGCSLYDYPASRNIDNGLDCSGFVSWALLNAGFDVKDVGAGWSDKLDLTDYGEVKKLDKEFCLSGKIRVGDLLHSEKAGGHIGIIVGIDDNYYYIAQALWFDNIGVIVTKAKKSELYKEFPHVVLMDKYYIEDGYLTNMWY